MSSKREQIVEYIVQALNHGVGLPAGLTVHRQRTIPIDADSLPAILVYVIDEKVEIGPALGIQSQNTPPQRKAIRHLTVRLELRVDASALATAPDSSLDSYHIWIASRMGADPTMGGLSHDCKEISSIFDAKQGDKIYAASQTDFDVGYVTLSNDLTTDLSSS